MNDEDRLISVLPIHYSNKFSPRVQIHQFPLLTRPLQVPPSAAASGKRIRARLKPNVKRFEIHVPVDTRPDVWNVERSKELGAARVEDDKEKNQEQKQKSKEGEEPRLSENRLRSEQIPQIGTYVLGVIRDGKLLLHPIAETHQLRPTLTYMDILTRKTKHRSGGDSDNDSDDGPPPDPDDPLPPPAAPKKDKKPTGEAREVQVSVRKSGDDKSMQSFGGLTGMRRELLMSLRAEEDEQWEEYEYCGREAAETNEAFEAIFSHNEEELQCKTDITAMLAGIKGL